MAGLSRIRICLVLAAALAAPGCRAQSSSAGASPAASSAKAPGTQSPLDLKTQRNIEITLRTKLKIPPEYSIHVGLRTPSTTPGFDTLPVTFELPGHPENTQKLEFLISDDSRTLERVARWDVSQDAASAIPSDGRPVRGNPNAKVVLVNFDDLECPFCAKLHSELFPDTLEHYKGLIKIVYHDMPIEELHPWAMRAAVNANCLAAQSGDAYWSYVDYLHLHGEDITGPDRDIKKSNEMLDKETLLEGGKSKLDTAKLGACIAKQDESGIRAELKVAADLDIDQTPTLYVNGEVIEGALPEDVLWRAIDRALVSEGVTPPPNPYDQPAKPAAPVSKPAAAAPSTK